MGVERSRQTAAAGGMLAAAVSLGVTEFVAGASGGRSLIVSVGDWVILHAPRALVAFAKRNFGTNDKAVLVAGILVTSLLFGIGLGLIARHTFRIGALGIAAFGTAGLLAAIADPQHSSASAAFASVVGVGSGVGALWLLLRAPRTRGAGAVGPPIAASADRRAFLKLAAAAATVAGASALAGRRLLEHSTRALAAARDRLSLPKARKPVAAPEPSTQFAIDGVTPIVTPNRDFYKIDTALSYPAIDYEQWRLRVDGMVRHPIQLTYDELAAMNIVEQYVTIGCVSNEVGGDLVSTAAWRGVLLRDVLARVGVDARADQVVGRSVDDFTVGFPTAAALDGRGAMIALGMNGAPLPLAHGFPARLIVPGLYGYVSATKWLSHIELTRFDTFDAYWVQRGWSQHGPIKTQSRIDVPTPRRTLRAGSHPIAGVAWAPTRGISTVEVQIDDGPWQAARLADALNTDTWRQWVLPWNATPGTYQLRVRATDGTGTPQDPHQQPPEPDGATGYHTIHITVTP